MTDRLTPEAEERIRERAKRADDHSDPLRTSTYQYATDVGALLTELDAQRADNEAIRAELRRCEVPSDLRRDTAVHERMRSLAERERDALRAELDAVRRERDEARSAIGDLVKQAQRAVAPVVGQRVGAPPMTPGASGVILRHFRERGFAQTFTPQLSEASNDE